MFHIEYINELLVLSMILSSINCTFIQKTKSLIPNSKLVIIYSLIVNIVLSIFFCRTFTDLSIKNILWIGLFTFLGANSIYKTLEGKLKTHTELRSSK